MASVSERHPGGRPRTREASALFLRIKALAKRRGLRLDQLADKAGVCVATLYNIHDPKVSTAKALAAALGITIDRLTQTAEPCRETGRSARRPA
jgi:transcriptional regulator with XRE-family HTH domain